MDLQSLYEVVDELSSEQLDALIEYAQHKRLQVAPLHSIKVGIISDIHGDYEGYEKALLIFEREGVSQILCAGDIVDRGPDADSIVLSIQQHGIVCVAGNHDHTVVHHQERWRQTDKPERLKQLGRIISDETVAFLQTLPDTTTVSIMGVRILIAHGTPWSDVLSIFPDTRQAFFDRMVERYSETADLIVLGHTHHPMWVRTGGMWIINPGSIYGVTARDSHTCGILTLPDVEFVIYDLETGERVPVNLIER